MVDKETIKNFLKLDWRKVLICFLIASIVILLFPSIFLIQIYCTWCPCNMMLPYPEGCPKVYTISVFSIPLIILSYLLSSFVIYLLVERNKL